MEKTEERAQWERQINSLFAARSLTSQIGLYGDMTHAAQGFFKEGSSGYKALETAEKAFRAVEFELSVRAMAQDAIETAPSLAKSGARTATKAVEADVSANIGRRSWRERGYQYVYLSVGAVALEKNNTRYK